MGPNLENISTFARNIFSQNGEDGILEEVLSRLKSQIPLTNWCVEFGAWDGIYLSNTAHLIKNLSFNAVLIEGDKRKAKEIKVNLPKSNVIAVNKYVDFDGNESLDSILQTTPIPTDFDFLSIDIDGADFHIFKSLEHYSPKIVCIEFNPQIPVGVEFIQERSFRVKQGSSATSISNLAKSKGYELIAITNCNLIFIRNEFLGYLQLEDGLIGSNLLQVYPQSYNFVWANYDGSVMMSQDLQLHWHGLSVHFSNLQVLPKFLRRFPDDYNYLQRALFTILRSSRYKPKK
jgi:hypothetical protein